MNTNSQWIGTASVDLTHSGYLASGTVIFTRQATPQRQKFEILTVLWWLGQVCTLRKRQCGRKVAEHSQQMGPTRTLAIRHAMVDPSSSSMLLGGCHQELTHVHGPVVGCWGEWIQGGNAVIDISEGPRGIASLSHPINAPGEHWLMDASHTGVYMGPMGKWTQNGNIALTVASTSATTIGTN